MTHDMQVFKVQGC